MTSYEAAIRLALPCLILASTHLAFTRCVTEEEIPPFLRRRRIVMDRISPYVAGASLCLLLVGLIARM
ncbi:hypothetical protein ABTX24_23775 [Nocardioides sp. NPDC127514]|uniref:hypothetical protein n=1 Tax=unclassified Nocardioides TaxID=2615069 RepID=UPI0033315AD0